MAARHANNAAQTLTGIERQRWHTELTPQFQVSCTPRAGGRATLRVTFVRPTGLDRLDEVAVAICDDTRDHSSILAGGPTKEEVSRQIWGPYRLAPGVDGADNTGRRVPPVRLLRGGDRPFELEATRPPRWWGSDDAWWDHEYRGSPVRLALHCRREGHEQWTVPLEVTPTEAGTDVQQ